MVQCKTHFMLLNKKWGSSQLRGARNYKPPSKQEDCMCFRVCIFLFFFFNGWSFWLLSPLFVVICFVVVCINISMEMVRPNLFKLSQQQKSTLFYYFNYALQLFLDLLPVVIVMIHTIRKQVCLVEKRNILQNEIFCYWNEKILYRKIICIKNIWAISLMKKV